MIKALLTAGALLVAGAVVASAQVRSGGEVRANDFTTGNQSRPVVAIDADDNFVVVWDSFGQDGDLEGVFVRRFDESGSALGPERQVNTYTTDFQRNPAVAMWASGEFVVVWQSFHQDGSYGGIFGQMFDASAAPVGSEFQVNSMTTDTQRLPSVAMDPSGNFVVVWSAYDLQNHFDVWGRQFDGSGNPIGPDFLVNSYTSGHQTDPSVAIDGAGNFVVVWHSASQGGVGRLFDVSGASRGPEFQLGTGPAFRPRVAMDAAGAFMVVWKNSYYEGVGARGFDASGAPAGPEITVRTGVTANDGSVAVDDAGHFVVAWQQANDYDLDGPLSLYGEHIRTRRYDGAGNPLGPELVASTYWTYTLNKGVPSVAARTPGKFIVAWQSWRQDGSDYGVFARSPDVLFVDAFETRDLSSWSASATDGGDLQVTHEARMGGSPSPIPSSGGHGAGYGLQATVDDQANLLVQDNTPNAEPRYRARFYLDPNGFDPGEAIGRRRQLVFLALSEAPLKRLVMILLRRIDGQYAIGVQVLRDDDTLAKPSFFPVSDGPHAIEFDWQRATAPGANDGRFDLWVDGTPAIAVTGLDNDQRSVDLVRMGALSVKAGASGTLFFDEFVSRRLAYIGP
jgi:hypothetical protein